MITYTCKDIVAQLIASEHKGKLYWELLVTSNRKQYSLGQFLDPVIATTMLQLIVTHSSLANYIEFVMTLKTKTAGPLVINTIYTKLSDNFSYRSKKNLEM